MVASTLEQRKQGSAWRAWLKSKNLQLIPPSWESPRELAAFLQQRGCDLSLWGYEKNSKNIEALYRELVSYKSCLCENAGGETTTREVARCVCSLRVRFVNNEEQVLVQEVTTKLGTVVPSPLSIRQRMGETPFRAAERLLHKLTGVQAHRERKGEEGGPVGTLQLQRSSLSMKGIVYSPLQFEDPVEYESLSSGTYPTLSTFYRINTLSLRLQELGDPGTSTIARAAAQGRTLTWLSKEHARFVYEHLEISAIVDAKASKVVQDSSAHNHENNPINLHHESATAEELFLGLNDDEDDDGRERAGQNHTLVHLASSQRYLGPASVTHDASRGQMASVLVNVLEKVQLYLAKKQREKAFGLISTMDWMHTASTKLASPFRAAAGNRSPLASPGWDSGEALGARDGISPHQHSVQGTAATSFRATEVGSGNEDSHSYSLKSPQLKARKLVEGGTSSSMSGFFNRFSMEIQMQTVFKSMSFNKYGELTPLADCPWFKTIRDDFSASRDDVLCLSDNAISLFRLWLVSAGLDLSEYSDKMVSKLLAETLAHKCELLLHPTTHQLERVTRIAKVLIYEKADSGNESSGDHATSSQFLEAPPDFARRLVVQRVSTTNNEELRSDGTGQAKVQMSFSVMLNQKAKGNEYMVDVVDDIVQTHFRHSLETQEGDGVMRCKPYIKSLYMLEPTAERNISPTFPGLSSRYFLHQFWVRLGGIPDKANFLTRSFSRDTTSAHFWMWMDGVRTGALENRASMLEYLVTHSACKSNLLSFMQSQRSMLWSSSENALTQSAVDWSYLNLYKTQLIEGCKTDDAKLVIYASEQIMACRAAQRWKGNERSNVILEAVGAAMDSKSWHAANALLGIFVHISLESQEAASAAAAQPGSRPNSRPSSPSWPFRNGSGSPISPSQSLKQIHLTQSLPYFNIVLVIASLINARPIVMQMKEALVAKKVEKLAAAAFCVVPTIQLGHAKMLRLLLRMVPHFVNGPFYPTEDASLRHSADPNQPMWTDEARTLRKFGLTRESLQLLFRAHVGLSVFIPGHSDLVHSNGTDMVPTESGYLGAIWRYVIGLFGVKHATNRVQPIKEEDSKRTIRPFGWPVLLATIAPQRKSLKPLEPRMTEVLGVALAFCPPDLPAYKDYMAVYLISIVCMCWNDNTIFGYELESQRMIVTFLEECHFPFHSALLMVQILRKLSKGGTYYSTELAVLHEWMHQQVVHMLDSCTSQEEANAVLFEQVRVETEITTAQVFVGRHAALDAGVHDEQSTAETSALFMAIASRVENVVASKWFQGTNENKVWFYEWWRPDRFPAVYEAHASSLLRTVTTTVLIMLELILLIPVWCLAPFSVKLSAWRDSMAINSAYFKFLSHTMLHCVFVVLVCYFAAAGGPIDPDTGRVRELSELEQVVYVWSLGLIASEAHAIYFDPMNYMESAVNVVDCVFLGCFAGAYVTRTASINMDRSHEPGWVGDSATDLLWLSADGNRMTAFGMASLSEILLAIGSLLAVYRLVHLSSFHQRLGPLYESIIKMGGDISFFSFLLVILLFGNSLAMVFLLRRYDAGEGTYLAPDEASTGMAAGFSGVVSLLGRLVFSGEVPQEQLVGLSESDQAIFSVLVVAHVLLVGIVLLSLLIAMMNRTYERTQDDSNVVYLNGRMELINDYASLAVVPPPFNLITIPFEVLALVINHYRYGNSRAVYLKQRRGASVRELIDQVNLFQSFNSGDAVVSARLQELCAKKKYGVNNSMRKIRTSVMARYFDKVREELRMPSRQDSITRETKRDRDFHDHFFADVPEGSRREIKRMTSTVSIGTPLPPTPEGARLPPLRSVSNSLVDNYRAPFGPTLERPPSLVSPTVNDYLLAAKRAAQAAEEASAGTAEQE